MERKKSISTQCREKGNEFYKKSKDPTVNEKLRITRLDTALKHYNEAFNNAVTSSEIASASKNIGVASWSLVSLHLDDFRMLHHHAKNAVKHFEKGLQYGAQSMTLEWREALFNQYYQCVEAAVQHASGGDGEKGEGVYYVGQIRLLEILGGLISEHYCALKSQCFLQISQLKFRKSLQEITDANYEAALNTMTDCYFPVEETKRLAAKTEEGDAILAEIRITEEDLFLNRCLVESVLARETGDALLEDALQEEELLNMTAIFEVLDWYKRAVLLTRETEIEMEAIALSRLGCVYDEVLKIKYKAKENFMKAVQLAHSLHPRTFHTEEWYMKATAALSKYQQKLRSEEEKRQETLRQKILLEIKDELKLLEENSTKTAQDFTKFLYKSFPPKTQHTKLTEAELKLSGPSFKKLFMKVILAYHPDKQDKKDGEKWQVLCEEISKTLNNKYEWQFKAGS